MLSSTINQKTNLNNGVSTLNHPKWLDKEEKALMINQKGSPSPIRTE